MRWAMKPEPSGEDSSLRSASWNRRLALMVGLTVLAPMYYGAIFHQPVAFLATPDVSVMATPPTEAPDMTGPANAAAVAELMSPVARAVTPVATLSPAGADRLFALTTTACAGLGQLNAIDIARLAQAAGFPDGQVAVAVAVAFAEAPATPRQRTTTPTAVSTSGCGRSILSTVLY